MSANAEVAPAAVENTAENSQTAASNPVEGVTESLKNVNLEANPDTSEADAAIAASAAEGRRLYIGNLAYSTTDEQLKEFFSGYKVESTSIPTNPRTGRAVGYAFVDVTTKEEADRAIAELSGKEVQERKVSVQPARKPDAAKSGNKKEATEGGKSADARRRANRSERNNERNGERGERGGRGGRGGRKRGRGQQATEHTSGDEEKSTPTNVPGQVLPLVESTNVKTETTESAPAAGGENQNNHNNFKAKKKRGPPENGVPSLTKVMVANLPYELSEEKLKELFAPYQPESAKIALRPIPSYMVRKLQARGEPRKGRGFGFVNLSSEEMQQKAVAEMNGKVVDGREIAVKVAIDSQTSDGEDKENHVDEGSKTQENADVQNGVKAENEPTAV